MLYVEFLLMHIGLIAGGFKPFTSGHYHLVSEAAKENDVVHLFVSTKDRARAGQHSITWKQMEQVWKIIEPTLPKNVKVHYSNNPTTSQFDVLTAAEEDSSNTGNVYHIYADETDIKRYDNPRIKERLLPRLWSNAQLRFESFKRSDTSGVSGTKVRQALADGDLEAFTQMMPAPVQPHAHHIFKLLSS